MATDWTLGNLLALSGAYWQSFLLQTAVERDVFTVVDNATRRGEPTDATALAQTLGCDARALDMLLTALTALGLLERTPDGIALPEHSRIWLSRNSPEYAGHLITHHAHLVPAWSALSAALTTGGPTRAVSSADTDDETEREAFLMGMVTVAMNQAQTVAAALDLTNRQRLLDLGGGPGTYALYFCQANPALRATVFDRPTTEPFARKLSARLTLGDRVDFVGGDFVTDPLPQGYDAAWLSQVLHGLAPAEATELVQRAARTLTPGGLLAIQEFVLDNDRTGPKHPALFSLHMLVGTPGGQSYTWAELETMLQKAGAVRITRLEAALPMGCGILVGHMR